MKIYLSCTNPIICSIFSTAVVIAGPDNLDFLDSNDDHGTKDHRLVVTPVEMLIDNSKSKKKLVEKIQQEVQDGSAIVFNIPDVEQSNIFKKYRTIKSRYCGNIKITDLVDPSTAGETPEENVTFYYNIGNTMSAFLTEQLKSKLKINS